MTDILQRDTHALLSNNYILISSQVTTRKTNIIIYINKPHQYIYIVMVIKK